MVALKQVKNPICSGFNRQRGREFCSFAQVVRKTAIHYLRESVVPAANCVNDDLMYFAAREFVENVSGRKSIETASKSMGNRSMGKQIG